MLFQVSVSRSPSETATARPRSDVERAGSCVGESDQSGQWVLEL